MEAGGHGFAEQGPRRLSVRTIAEITQNLIDCAVLFHDVDNVLSVGAKEAHYAFVGSGWSEQVSVINRHPCRQTPKAFAIGNPSANKRSVFQLKLILVVRPQDGRLRRIAAREGAARGRDVLDEGKVPVAIARVRTGVALAVADVHPLAIGTECDVSRVVRSRDQADRGESMWPAEWYYGDRVRAGIHRIKQS